MCIILLTTAHPRYRLIAIDNRDEYVLRPTSRPYWWTHRGSGHRILSSRDLHRSERGTWMGITEGGRFAVLTNYRESKIDDPDRSVAGVKSRGEIVNFWLGDTSDDNLDDFVKKTLDDGSIKAVGGFSLVCGDLKPTPDKKDEPLVIVSNRSDDAASVPRLCQGRGETLGLSNTIYSQPPTWPKVTKGQDLLSAAIQYAVERDLGEDDLIEKLFEVLDDNTMPLRPDMDITDFLDALRHSVFVPAFSTDKAKQEMAEAVTAGIGKPPFDVIRDDDDDDNYVPKTDPKENFLKGAYGTQRQTIILVDWEGNVLYKERALFDAHGNKVEKDDGDMQFRFTINPDRP